MLENFLTDISSIESYYIIQDNVTNNDKLNHVIT